MKLALVSDLHGVKKTLEYLQKILEKDKPDGVIISGDISDRSDISFVNELFEILSKNQIEGYMICGNADQGEAQKMIDESEYSINQKCKSAFKICGLCDHEEMLMPDIDLSSSIFVSHRPPSVNVLKQKMTRAPMFHIAGHLHTRQIAKQYPSTMLIQVPTLQNGRYAIFWPKIKKVEFSSI